MDLTKYVETHEFVFDEAFDAESTNDDVCQFSNLYLTVLTLYATGVFANGLSFGGVHFLGRKGDMLRIVSDF